VRLHCSLTLKYCTFKDKGTEGAVIGLSNVVRLSVKATAGLLGVACAWDH